MPGLGNLGGVLTSGAGASTGAAPLWQNLLTGGLLASGEVGNILEGHKQSSYQDYILNLLKNPQLIAQMASKIAQPVSGAETQAVENSVQGNLAQRGLAQSPGIFAATESQALAPLEAANYNQALQTVMQSLGLPQGTFGQPTNLSPLLGLFLRGFGNKGAGTTAQPGGTGTPSLPGPIDQPSPSIPDNSSTSGLLGNWLDPTQVTATPTS